MFRIGDVVADPFDRVYRVLGSAGAERVKVVLWNGQGFDPIRYQLPVAALRHAPEAWEQVKAVRRWEAETQETVSVFVRRALELVGEGAK